MNRAAIALTVLVMCGCKEKPKIIPMPDWGTGAVIYSRSVEHAYSLAVFPKEHAQSGELMAACFDDAAHWFALCNYVVDSLNTVTFNWKEPFTGYVEIGPKRPVTAAGTVLFTAENPHIYINWTAIQAMIPTGCVITGNVEGVPHGYVLRKSRHFDENMGPPYYWCNPKWGRKP